MDLAEALKLDIKLIHTAKLKNRAQETKEHRTKNRNKAMEARRMISDTPLKPSPEAPKQKPTRLEMLKKWKEEKEKKKAEEKKKSKPIFKVAHVDSKTYNDVKYLSANKTFKFAPSAHKFQFNGEVKNDGNKQGGQTRRLLDFKATDKKDEKPSKENVKQEKAAQVQVEKETHVRTRAMAKKEDTKNAKEKEAPVKIKQKTEEPTKTKSEAVKPKSKTKQPQTSKSDAVIQNPKTKQKNEESAKSKAEQNPKTKQKNKTKTEEQAECKSEEVHCDSPKRTVKKPKAVTLVEHTPITSTKKVYRVKTPKVRLSTIRKSMSPESDNSLDDTVFQEDIIAEVEGEEMRSEKTSKIKSAEKVSTKTNEGIDRTSNVQKLPGEDVQCKNERLAELKNEHYTSTSSSSSDDDIVKFLKRGVKTPKKGAVKTPVESAEKAIPKTPKGRSGSRSKSLAFELDDKTVNDSLANCSTKSVSPCFPANNEVNLTPDPKSPLLTTYVSPFVTLSRGKERARKEYRMRVSRGGTSDLSPETTGPQAGAAYFTRLLDAEIARIEELCDTWKTYMESDLPEEPCNMINTALGQSGLLLSKRMKQFRGMIESCRTQDTDPLITCKDLHGYWDMLLTQVKNLDDRFENLVKLRENNWEEVLPVPLPVPKVVVTKAKPVVKRPARKAALKAGSSIRDAIKAARQKMKVGDGTENVFNGGFFMVKSPSKVIVESTPKKGRKSLLKAVLTAEKARKSSMAATPSGLVMCSASRRSKSIGGVNVDSGEGFTPVKSILKPKEGRKSTVKKAVLFNEEIDETVCIKNTSYTISDENDPNYDNVLSQDSDDDSSRMSTRLTRRLFL